MGCATGVVKIIVFVFNFLCAIVGLTLLTLGAIAYVNNKGSDVVTGENVSFVSSFILALGVVIFIISFFGCCGVCQKSQCMLTTYSVILLALFVIHLSVSIYGYVQISKDVDESKKAFQDSMVQTFKNYNTDHAIQEAFNTFQKELHCCGVRGPQDYAATQLPGSCCKPANGTNSATPSDKCINHSLIYTEGCANKVFDLVNHELKKIVYVSLGICAVELVGAFFAICLVNSYRNEDRRYK